MADWAQISNLVLTIVNLVLTFFLHINYNKFKSSCCKDWFVMEEELSMQPNSSSPTSPSLPTITVTPPSPQ
jgi:hypothetical protein